MQVYEGFKLDSKQTRTYIVPDNINENRCFREYVEKLGEDSIKHELWDCIFKQGNLFVGDKRATVIRLRFQRSHVSNRDIIRSFERQLDRVLDRTNVHLLDHSMVDTMHETIHPIDELIFVKPDNFIRQRI